MNVQANVSLAEWRRKLLQAERVLIDLGCRGAATDIATTITDASELISALEQSNEAMSLARARWPTYPSPAQKPACDAIVAAMTRNNAVLGRLNG